MKNAERLNKTLAGKYTIESLIGSGGMGVVYAATHRLTRERVAVKFLRDEEMHDIELKRRFIKEAQAAANLRHPNVVRLIDLDEDPDYGMYMVLELLSGEALSELLTRVERLPLGELCEILFPIMHALGAAHDRGILHRDIKPANIFLHREPDGRVVPKLLDFGIVRMLPLVSAMLTRTGEILGTPDYMSPEQAYGEKLLGPPTDVWAMAVVAYRAVCGVAPFARDNLEATMLDVASGTYSPLDERCPELPYAAALQGVIGRALTREVRRRTPSMPVLMRELAEVANVDAAAILARFGLVAPDPGARRSPARSRPEPQVDDSAVTARIAPRRRPARSLWLAALLLLAALCAAWGAFTAFRPG
jgi:serine/threonine-protein kinase